MLYSNVYIDAFGYELPPNIISTDDLENRLSPLYDALHLKKGQIEAMTGIYERRWWNPDFSMGEGAIQAGKKALAKAFNTTGITPKDIGMLVYGGGLPGPTRTGHGLWCGLWSWAFAGGHDI